MNILTFDIEDWFHILDNPSTEHVAGWSSKESRVEKSTDILLETLNRRKHKATFFILGWIADRYPSVVRRILEAGHDIGTHSYDHQLVYKQSAVQFRSDLKRSLDILQDISGRKVEYYRSPGFSITKSTPWAFDILIENGITVDCSIFPARRAHGGYLGMYDKPFQIETDSGRLFELPINIVRLLGIDIAFSGGGYFRLLPYIFIQRQLKRSNYVMTYFHPRDFDKGQPVIEGLTISRRFKCYVGISSAIDKLNRMIQDFDFIDIGTTVQSIDWENTPVVIIDRNVQKSPKVKIKDSTFGVHSQWVHNQFVL
jgi:polysaccharide deacetylase family protein (PEP-CTERM system associated)